MERYLVNNFYEAWNCLEDHSYFGHPIHKQVLSAFPASLYIEVVKVNPDTMSIDDNEALNTKTQVWLECGGYIKVDEDYEVSHDPLLDTGGDTFEQAILNLYDEVKRHYGFI